ncbi:type I restriction endonuclease, partial [Akkermansiaceae bacterium]|nr:type I restriction endonuclease [Akkermansiaceae bacterium]
MPEQPRSERETQNRLLQLFTHEGNPQYLGYAYLGDWQKRDNNRCIERDILTKNLSDRGYSSEEISAALIQLESDASAVGKTLYEVNLKTYDRLRYGAPVQIGSGTPTKDIHFIDWENPEKNHFGIAQEVTLKGGLTRRPDLVLYINGIAIGVIELKRSSVAIEDGIRQLYTNQEEQFNKGFFSTVQFVFAGNDSVGLKYGTTGTREKYFLHWKAPKGAKDEKGYLLDLPIAEMCNKETLLDLIYNCVIFDAGTKKVPRMHQYIAFKKSQERIGKGEGGVIWHTQGSGKSILMVLLAKWLRAYDPHARVLIVTDRDELDKQIEGVMRNARVLTTACPSPRIESRDHFIGCLED